MKFSLIIPTLNAGDSFFELLDSIKQQTLQPCEIIIIDSSSIDHTSNIAKIYGCHLKNIDRSAFDHGGTRTIAALSAKGDVLVYLTQDSIPATPSTFELILKKFATHDVGAVYGRQLPYQNACMFGAHLRYFNYPEQSYRRTYSDIQTYGIKTAFLSNSFCAYKKSALQEISYFKNNLILGEDMIAGALLLKKGYALAYASDAKVYHSHDYTIWQEFKRYFDIGVLHRKESWLLEEFGKPEGEGLKYVLSEWKFLISNQKKILIISSILRNLFKFIGYKLGRIHPLLPRRIIKKISMHHTWWEKL